jgi:hypothetical protein
MFDETKGPPSIPLWHQLHNYTRGKENDKTGDVEIIVISNKMEVRVNNQKALLKVKVNLNILKKKLN